MDITVEPIETQVKQLSRDDLRKVGQLVDSLLKETEHNPAITEEKFEKQLAEDGFITEYKPPITDFSLYANYEPVTVTGEPISETMIRERR